MILKQFQVNLCRPPQKKKKINPEFEDIAMLSSSVNAEYNIKFSFPHGYVEFENKAHLETAWIH